MRDRPLPRIFDYVDISMHPMYYDRTEHAFSLAGKSVPLSSPDLVRETYFPSGKSVTNLELLEHPVHMGQFGNPFATPRFYNWLQKECGPEDLRTTRQVILEVYEELSGVEAERDVSRGGEAYSPEADFLRPGHLVLATIGNCACFYVKIDSHLVEDDEWGTGFAEYEFHNTDNDAQRISLLAGMGHLATSSVR